MKVIGINGSARKDGNTSLLIGKAFEALNKNGIETELIQLSGKKIAPCRACFTCGGKNKCSFANDDFYEIFEKMLSADGIILGSPVYAANISAAMQALLERAAVVESMNNGLFKHKAGAAVAAVRRGGALNVVDAMTHFFMNKEMYIVGSTYWNMVYGRIVGEVLEDSEGMENMYNIGENMAFLLKKLTGSTGNDW
ncbi:MAG: flavodoxin family protein [Oscillospiraceae bacterium]|nr:flavodoxin family protein [Oscillospiraceae bacterium]